MTIRPDVAIIWHYILRNLFRAMRCVYGNLPQATFFVKSIASNWHNPPIDWEGSVSFPARRVVHMRAGKQAHACLLCLLATRFMFLITTHIHIHNASRLATPSATAVRVYEAAVLLNCFASLQTREWNAGMKNGNQVVRRLVTAATTTAVVVFNKDSQIVWLPCLIFRLHFIIKLYYATHTR